MKKGNRGRRVLALLLTLLTICSMLPATAFAAGDVYIRSGIRRTTSLTYRVRAHGKA